MNVDEINDKLNSLIRQRDKLIIDVNTKNEELIELLEQKYKLDSTMVQVDCIQCNALGRVKSEEGTQIICPTCRGTGYIWMKLYTPEEKK